MSKDLIEFTNDAIRESVEAALEARKRAFRQAVFAWGYTILAAVLSAVYVEGAVSGRLPIEMSLIMVSVWLALAAWNWTIWRRFRRTERSYMDEARNWAHLKYRFRKMNFVEGTND